MPYLKRFVQVVAYVFIGAAFCAAESDTTDIEARLANIERMLAAQSGVQQAAYPQMMAQADVPYDAMPYEAAPEQVPYEPTPDQVLPDEAVPVPVAPEEPISDELALASEFLCACRPRSDSWIFGVDIIPTRLHITRWEWGSWPDEHTVAARFNLGYEKADGIGVRGRFWIFDQEASAYDRDVDVSAYKLDLDVYKRIIIDDTEIMLGGGSSFSHLEFELVPERTESDFSGAGPRIFVEVYQPLLRQKKTDIGFVGRAGMSLLVGNWRDTTGTALPSTDDDTMAIWEAATGLEMRRYFGQFEDKYWHLSVISGVERWESDWMGAFLGSSATFVGLNVNLGVVW